MIFCVFHHRQPPSVGGINDLERLIAILSDHGSEHFMPLQQFAERVIQGLCIELSRQLQNDRDVVCDAAFQTIDEPQALLAE